MTENINTVTYLKLTYSIIFNSFVLTRRKNMKENPNSA